MAYINLLPWREEAEKAKQRQYFSILALVGVIAFAIVFIISQYFQARIDGQSNRNQYLTNEIKILDVRIGEIKTLNQKKKELEQRMDVVEQLQRSRNVGTQVLNEIAKIIPNGIYLTHLKKVNNTLELVGRSESNNHLANMIREIERSDLFIDAVLESITSKDAESKLLSDFKMRVSIKGLKSNMQDKSTQGGS
jgi:type IV pilus assembly protein PilN